MVATPTKRDVATFKEYKYVQVEFFELFSLSTYCSLYLVWFLQQSMKTRNCLRQSLFPPMFNNTGKPISVELPGNRGF